MHSLFFFFFFFNDTATTEIYTLSLHDALPILLAGGQSAVSATVEAQIKSRGIQVYRVAGADRADTAAKGAELARSQDRKSTRLNSSHSQISYAVFCLKKKKNNTRTGWRQIQRA